MAKNEFEGLLADMATAAANNELLLKSETLVPEEKGEVDADGKPIPKKTEAKKPDGAETGDESFEDFGKSFSVTLEDGSKLEAVDGTAMMKALHGQVGTLRGNVAELMTKSLGVISDLQKVVQNQGLMIKSQAADIAKFGNSGVGRKAVVSLIEKAKPAPEESAATMDANVFMAKAREAVGTRISEMDLAHIETCLNRGIAPEPAMLARVLRT